MEYCGGVLLLALSTQPVLAGTKKCPLCGSQTNPVQENGGLYKFNENIKPFVPSDLTYANRAEQWSLICNEDSSARSSPGGPVTGDCGDYVSHQNKTKWRLHISGGHIDKIFLIDRNGKAHRYVEFAGGSDIYRITYQSPKAEKFAKSNGYRYEARNQTMVKAGAEQDSSPATQSEPNTQSAPQATSSVDCASKTALLEKMKCIADEAAAMKK